ncbi:ankyrin-1-like [Lolium rigidum]|uniref:ankyrin-1-like n=1 Tax=Lolium rigidum TaxID=89674 RepID=UPI001F5C9E0F|nr:ankyrin-1-like [Lolium rigidum]
MKILLDHHADRNRILNNLYSPLMIAINSHSVKCVNLLLEAGADVNGIRGSTPLHAAAINGLTDIFKPLLDAGADPNVRNEYGLRPIQHAAYSGTRKGVEILFEVTSRIPAIHDWSIDGIISHVKSLPKLEDLPLYKMSRAELKEEGHKALQKGDFNAAIEFYNMAMLVDPENIDSNLFGTRGLCRLLLGNGEGALNDAHLCRAIRPDADSCWLQGYSHLQLKEYEKACGAFLDGLKLKPCFAGIEKGLRQALSLLKDSHADKKNGIEGRYREARLFLW